MSRILVVYASHFGQTRKIAFKVAEQLRARGHEVEVGDVHSGLNKLPPPADYDAVVAGSRVEMGRHAPELCTYLRDNADALREIPTAVFSVCMAAARAKTGPDPNGYLRALFDDIGWHPTRWVSFAGGLPYRKYGWLLRLVMRQISRSAGHTTDTSQNHEFTNWHAVRRFADEVAELARRQRVVETAAFAR